MFNPFRLTPTDWNQLMSAPTNNPTNPFNMTPTEAANQPGVNNPFRSSPINPTLPPTEGGNTGVPINASADTPFDFSNILKQAQGAYGSDAISQYYNLARGNLNRSMGNASSFASRAAGAAGTNMVNPSSFVQSAISGAQSNFAPQYGQLAAQGAQAQQQGQAKLTELLYLINRAKQGDAEAAAQLKARYDEGAESVRQFNANREDNGAGVGDYLFGGLNVASNVFGSGLWDSIFG